MYGIFRLSKSQVKKLYKKHPGVRKPGSDETGIDIVIPLDPKEKCTIQNAFGTHLGYITFEDAWRL
jgi:hypothetical protein